jgi:ubiquinone/menaquinone biosynthesis C-methylase UbiE
VSVQRFYGGHARLYDAVAGLFGPTRWRARAVDALRLEPGDTVVEMGCGTGANLPLLRERVPEGRVVGVDLTRPLLARARDRAPDGRQAFHLVRGDATRPPLSDADAVLGTFVLGLFDDPAAVVERWCDLVGPGGRVAVLEATRSGRLAGAALNPAFDLFVHAGSPTGEADASRALGERVRDAHGALAARTVDRHHDSFGLGFLDLFAGTVEE